MSKTFFIILSYSGTNYHGWQIQPDVPTVQETLENAISTVLNTRIEITGAGRTDTGVHASCYVAHFITKKVFDFQKIIFRLNCYLPKDIVIQNIIRADDHAHARFSAISRTYTYIISKVKNPFLEKQTFHIYGNLDIDKMNEAGQFILGKHEFTTFSKLHSNNKNDYCTIETAKWEEIGNFILFTITADRFLRNMVRSIAGTLLDVGKGKIKPDQFKEILDSKDKSRASTSAPAEGLYLTSIKYPPEFQVECCNKYQSFPFLI